MRYEDINLPSGYTYPGPTTSEIDRMELAKKESKIISNFMFWVENSGMRICKVDRTIDRYAPIGIPMEQFLAQYFNIDLEIVEQEKLEVLAYMRIKDGGNPETEREELGLEQIELKKTVLRRNRAKRPAMTYADEENMIVYPDGSAEPSSKGRY
jgi:hypothetical protein